MASSKDPNAKDPKVISMELPKDPTPPVMGDCLFFKVAKKESRRNAKEMKFKGHAFGVYLGHVPPFGKDPQPDQLLRMMGQIGFLTFDDVSEFVGAEAAEKCVKMYEDKYYGKEAQDAADEVPTGPIEQPERPSLVDAHGTPIKAPSLVKTDETTN